MSGSFHRVRATETDPKPPSSLAATMADVSDGQRLLAVNDLFIGPKSHTSAHYASELGERKKAHSYANPT